MEFKRMRPAITMIELTLVIVIIGILASIAIERLFATRDDAKITTDIANMSACINDAGMYYTAYAKNLQDGDSDNCDSVKCFDITYGTDDSDFTVDTNPDGADYCDRVDELGGHLAKTYHFHGTNVVIE